MKPTALHDNSRKMIMANHDCSTLPVSYDFHFHDNYEIYLFLNGAGEMLVNHTRYPLSPGSLLIFNSNEVHKVFPDNSLPYERMTIHFNPALIRALPLQGCNLLTCFQNHSPGWGNAAFLSEEGFQQFQSLVWDMIPYVGSSLFGSEAMALSCLMKILVITNQAFLDAAPGTLPISKLITQAIEYIDEHVSEPLSLNTLAGRMNADPFYLSHQFKAQTGASPYHYILIRKIAYAKQLLAKGAGCNQTCEQAGFGDYNNFCRTFKKYVGVTPSSYRKSNMTPVQDLPVGHWAVQEWM